MNMHLSRAIIPKKVAARRRVSDRYRWHQVAWEFFPGTDERNFIFRVDVFAEHFQLLLLSEMQAKAPEWVERVQTKEVASSFLQKDAYQFDFWADVALSDAPKEGEKRGRVRSVNSDEDALAWLQRKGGAHGFQITGAAVVQRRMERFWRKGAAGQVCAVHFQGTLQVKDHTLFTEAFQKGIGRGRSLGFGMLTLIPILNPTN